MVTTDCAVFRVSEHKLEVLLIARANAPFAGCWALPGGFLEPDETLAECAARELVEETGVVPDYLEQLASYGDPGRDPRGRTVTIAYLGLKSDTAQSLAAADDAADARWFAVSSLPSLAFDHARIIADALTRLRAKLSYSSIALKLLPAEFPLSALQNVCEAILGHPLDKRNFRKQILGLGVVEDTGRRQRLGQHRPAMLYRAATTRGIQIFR
ncbi:MAG: NUDIX hydrolase [Gammaproteobacteria bacterium]|nr:NUDIX hydrolase [Gammaproteobacteria bacterium]